MDAQCTAIPRIVKTINSRKKGKARTPSNELITIVVDGNFWMLLLAEIAELVDNMPESSRKVRTVKVADVMVTCDPYQFEEIRVASR